MRRLGLSDVHAIVVIAQSNPLYDEFIEFRDVFLEAVPCELPKNKGNRHEIDLKLSSRYCSMKKCPLPREQAIDKFFADRLEASDVRGSTSHMALRFSVCRNPQEGGG